MRKFSPRTRGCSGAAAGGAVAGTVFPAHAGMFRRGRGGRRKLGRFPRARGDVPALLEQIGKSQAVFPAHAGMFRNIIATSISILGFPRARGDVPGHNIGITFHHKFSPRTRGCSAGTSVRGCRV